MVYLGILYIRVNIVKWPNTIKFNLYLRPRRFKIPMKYDVYP